MKEEWIWKFAPAKKDISLWAEEMTVLNNLLHRQSKEMQEFPAMRLYLLIITSLIEETQIYLKVIAYGNFIFEMYISLCYIYTSWYCFTFFDNYFQLPSKHSGLLKSCVLHCILKYVLILEATLIYSHEFGVKVFLQSYWSH